jgi:hypothetical protein
MSQKHDWMPQFNWPVFGPLLGIIATLFIVSAVVGSRVLEREGGVGVTFGTNPERGAPLASNGGRGGPGPVLLAPEVEALKLRSLAARVNGTPTVRKGPGTQYGGLHSLQNGEEVHVIACSPGCEWYRILSLTDAEVQFWVSSAFLAVSGKADQLPVLTPQ